MAKKVAKKKVAKKRSSVKKAKSAQSKKSTKKKKAPRKKAAVKKKPAAKAKKKAAAAKPAAKATTISQYIAAIPADRQAAFKKLRKAVKSNIPAGFQETISYGMIGYVVPHKTYPDGYHCDPRLPLPFANIANQKNFIALYHMGLYSDKKLYDWFVKEYAKQCNHKLDMGKSCIRFKKFNDIPFELIGKLLKKVSVADWIKTYERSRAAPARGTCD